MPKVAFYTLGCKVNQYDTAAMAELFAQAGYEQVDFADPADVYVVNTCTVTQMSDKKSRQMISRAHALSPGAPILVTGCYAQRAPEELLRLPGVRVVAGTKQHHRVLEAAAALGKAPVNLVGPLTGGFEEAPGKKESRSRAYVKIQNGCNRYCSYCIVPYTRGPNVSRSTESIRQELLRLEQEGFREVVFTGIHVMSYGQDLPDKPGLIDVLRLCEPLPGIRRVRLSSLEPHGLSDRLVEYMARSGKICPHFHLSLQSGSDGVLQRMNRRYTAEEYALCAARLRKAMPGCAITTDVIAGFPGETREEFEQTLAFVARMQFARVHVFPYSRRAGTKAAQLPGQLPAAVKSARARELILLANKLEMKYLAAMEGSAQQVLAEVRRPDGATEGYTGNYARAVFWQPEAVVGEIYDVRIHGVQDGKLQASVIK